MISILVAEDEYFLADDVARQLERAGAQVLGPVGRSEEVLALLDAPHRIDAAVLDLNLRGQSAFAIADRLKERRIPFVFATGYDAHAIPTAYTDVPRLQKPTEAHLVALKVLELAREKSAPFSG